jgi:hypothetical protein
MTDPQWVAPGSSAPAEPQATPPGGHPAYPAVPASQPPAAPPPGSAPSGPPPGGSPPAGQPGWAGHPAMEFRPGVIPLRPLTLGDLYGAVIKAIRGNVAATMGLAFVTTLIFLVPTTAVGAWVASQQSLDLEIDPQSAEDVIPVAGTLGSLIPSLGTSGSAILLTGFVAFVISQAVMGRKVSAGQTWEGTRGRLLPLVGATIVTGLAIMLALVAVLVLPVLALVGAATASDDPSLVGAILLVVVAVLVAVLLVLFLSTRLAFVGVAVVLENAGVGQGIARSWRLTAGSQFWRVLGIRLLTGLIVGTAAQILSFPLGLIGGVGIIASGDAENLYVFQAVISGLSGLITGALTTPFTAGVDALLYVDQRIRREGFDVQLITAAQADAARQWPGATAGR